MTLFLNPLENSYERFGQNKAPLYISWSKENRSQLVRVPAALGEYQRVELRSPDPSTNTYLAFALIIYAVLDGIRNKTELPAPADINLYRADKDPNIECVHRKIRCLHLPMCDQPSSEYQRYQIHHPLKEQGCRS